MKKEIRNPMVEKMFLKAIEAGDLEAVKYLLNDAPIRADINWNDNGFNPNHYFLESIRLNQLSIIKYFLEETAFKKFMSIEALTGEDKDQCKTSIVKMHDLLGQVGDIETIKYIVKKIKPENRLQLITGAITKDNAKALEFILQGEVLTEVDNKFLPHMGEGLIELSYTSNAKESLKTLMRYYEDKSVMTTINSSKYKIEVMLKMVGVITKKTEDFELFNSLLKSQEVQSSGLELSSSGIFKEIMKKNLLKLYTQSLKQIEDKYILSSILKQGLEYGINKLDRPLKSYPFFKHILVNYSKYIGSADKENIFKNVANGNSKERFEELKNYKTFMATIDPNVILKSLYSTLNYESTRDLIKTIMVTPFKKKLKIHGSDNYYFRAIAENLAEVHPHEAIDLLQYTFENLPNISVAEVIPKFTNKEVLSFLNNRLLNEKLNKTMRKVSVSGKSIKI